jgi:hypothetical protein
LVFINYLARGAGDILLLSFKGVYPVRESSPARPVVTINARTQRILEEAGSLQSKNHQKK